MVWWPDCEHRSVLLGSPVVKKHKRARKADNQTLSASFLKNFSEFMFVLMLGALTGQKCVRECLQST